MPDIQKLLNIIEEKNWNLIMKKDLGNDMCTFLNQKYPIESSFYLLENKNYVGD